MTHYGLTTRSWWPPSPYGCVALLLSLVEDHVPWGMIWGTVSMAKASECIL